MPTLELQPGTVPTAKAGSSSPAEPAPSTTKAAGWPAGVWRADLEPHRLAVRPSGHPVLDAVLPGGGWPAGGLVELLSPEPGLLEVGLLAPLWRQSCQAQAVGQVAWVMLKHSTSQPYAPGLEGLGLNTDRILCLRPSTEGDAVWAVEQMLACTGIVAVWWISRHAQSQHLRRVHWASQRRGLPVMVSRPLACRLEPSAALVRLQVQAGPDHSIRVRVLKRPGPRVEHTLEIQRPQPLPLLPSRGIAAPARHLSAHLAVTPSVTPSNTPSNVVDRPVPSPVAA